MAKCKYTITLSDGSLLEIPTDFDQNNEVNLKKSLMTWLLNSSDDYINKVLVKDETVIPDKYKQFAVKKTSLKDVVFNGENNKLLNHIKNTFPELLSEENIIFTENYKKDYDYDSKDNVIIINAPTFDSDMFLKGILNKLLVDYNESQNNLKDLIQYSWARTSNNSYEVSSSGDSRFSALNAKLKDGRTIEEAYQLDIKGFRINGNNWRLGKGKPPIRNISKEQSWKEYKSLWEQFLNENPKLEKELSEKAKGKVLTDKFASTDISQARALAELLSERYNKFQNKELNPTNPKFIDYIGGNFGDTINSLYDFDYAIHTQEESKIIKSEEKLDNIDFEEDTNLGYRERTIKNASADVTIALAIDFNSAGEKLTKSSVLSQGKKYIPINANILEVKPELINNIVKELNSLVVNTLFEKSNNITLNIAGNGIYTMKGKYTQEQVDAFTYNLLNSIINSPELKVNITQIRTGGQTGFDEAGAKAAIRLGINTKILAPKGWKFRNIYGQDISSEKSFKERFEEPKQEETIKPEEVQETLIPKTETIALTSNFSRNSVQSDNVYIYLFTDNARRSSGWNKIDPSSWYAKKYGLNKNYPSMTQAVIRGLDNAYPITTMVDDNRTQWNDNQFEEYKKIVDDEINEIKNALNSGKFLGIKFAAQMPFGEGKISNMKRVAPKIFEYMTLKLKEIGIDNSGSFPKPLEITSQEKQLIIPIDIVPKTESKPQIIDLTNKTEGENFVLFKDGIKINTGNINLNVQQLKALQDLADFSNESFKPGNQTFGLKGYAGTGKTTLINLYLKYLAKKSPSKTIRISSPTNRANAVMRQKGIKNVSTLHSLFGLSPEIDLEEFDVRTAKFVKNKAEDTLERGDTLIIDESSMINNELYKFIKTKATELNVKVIFTGDGSQLKPVGQSELSKAFTDNDKSIELTIVERTGDNPLLKESTDLRTKSNAGNFSFKTNIQKGEGIVFTNNSANFIEEASNLYASEEFAENPLLLRIVSATNADVININNRIRKNIWGENESNEYNVGEILMGYSNFDKTPKGEYKIYNGGDYQVIEVNPTTKELIPGVKYNGFNLTVRDLISGSTENIFMLSKNTPQNALEMLGQNFENLRLKAINTPPGPAQRKAWVDLFSFGKKFTTPVAISYLGARKISPTLQYGYAHTIHSSQGGTYTYSFVLGNSIDIGFGRDPEQQNQLRYVAITRAEKAAIVLTNKGDVDKIPSLDIISKEDLSNINKKYGTSYTIEDFKKLSKAEQENILNCL